MRSCNKCTTFLSMWSRRQFPHLSAFPPPFKIYPAQLYPDTRDPPPSIHLLYLPLQEQITGMPTLTINKDTVNLPETGEIPFNT